MVRELYRQGLLPKIISGTSAGSVVAAVVCVCDPLAAAAFTPTRVARAARMPKRRPHVAHASPLLRPCAAEACNGHETVM